MHGYWRHQSKRGEFSIRPVSGRWHVFFEDQNLGSYHSPVSALEDLVGGHTFWPSPRFDPSEIGLPDDLSEWETVLGR